MTIEKLKEKRGTYPLRRILMDIASSRNMPITYFRQQYFLAKAQKEKYPVLAELSTHFHYPSKMGLPVSRKQIIAFESSFNGLNLAYFGIPIQESIIEAREQGLVIFDERSIYLGLYDEGIGRIRVVDRKTKETELKLGREYIRSLGSETSIGVYSFCKPPNNPSLPGVKAFLEFMLK